MYKQNSMSQAFGRDGDDSYLKYNQKAAGQDNIYTFDVKKQFSSRLAFRTDPWIVSDMFDTWTDFDINYRRIYHMVSIY